MNSFDVARLLCGLAQIAGLVFMIAYGELAPVVMGIMGFAAVIAYLLCTKKEKAKGIMLTGAVVGFFLIIVAIAKGVS